MKQNSDIEALFRSAFDGHEMPVSDGVWAGVQSAIGNTAAAAGASSVVAGGLKVAIATAIAVAVSVAIVNEVNMHTQGSGEGSSHNVVSSYAGGVPESSEIQPDHSDSQTTQYQEHAQETVAATEPRTSAEEIQKPDAAHQSAENAVVEALAEGDEPESDHRLTATVDAMAKDEVSESSGSGAQPDESAGEKYGSMGRHTDDMAERSGVEVVENDSLAQGEKETAEEEEPLECQVYLGHAAKAFISPDGDGTNECFYLKDARNVDPSTFNIRIWTREGRLVFESTDVNFRRCGTDLSNALLPNRTACYYEIIATDYNGLRYEKRNARGSIMVFR